MKCFLQKLQIPTYGTSTEHSSRNGGQRRIHKAGQHAAARNVAEVTERHRNWLGNLGDKVHRGHNHNRLGKAFQPAAEREAKKKDENKED